MNWIDGEPNQKILQHSDAFFSSVLITTLLRKCSVKCCI